MSVQQEKGPRLADLEQAIRHGIVRRTGGRLQALEVEAVGDRIEIRGRVASFHLKQLAIQGVFDVIGSVDATPIELDVRIGVGPSRSEARAV